MTYVLDIRSVLVPSTFTRGIERLLARLLKPTEARQANHLYRRLFGEELTFGRLALVGEDELRDALKLEHLEADSLVRLREVAQLLAKVSPETRQCSSCQELMLANVGGRTWEFKDGNECPACHAGTVVLHPMRLRKIAWTTGELTEPQISVDVSTVPGASIPLTDEGILHWSDRRLHPMLERQLMELRAPLYVLLAYLFHGPKRVRCLHSVDEVPEFLHKPQDYGFADRDAIRALVLEALAFSYQRERWNGRERNLRAAVLRHEQPDAPIWTLNGVEYLVEGCVGRGEKSLVYRAHSLYEPPRSVTIKLANSPQAAAHFLQEARALERIANDTTSEATKDYARRIHQVADRGDLFRGDTGETVPAIAFEAKPGYDWNLAEALAEYPKGIPSHAVAWIGRRMFEEMAWLHQIGIVHGAIVPEHVLIYPFTHHATLIDHGYAVSIGQPVEYHVIARKTFYPPELLGGESAMRAFDVAMGARCLLWALTGEVEQHAVLRRLDPDPLTDFLLALAGYDGLPTVKSTYHEVFKPYRAAVEAAHGKPRYIRFDLPVRRS